MKKIFTDFKCFITTLVTVLIGAIIVVSLVRNAIPDEVIIALFGTFTAIASSIFTYYFTKKSNNDNSINTKERDE